MWFCSAQLSGPAVLLVFVANAGLAEVCLSRTCLIQHKQDFLVFPFSSFLATKSGKFFTFFCFLVVLPKLFGTQKTISLWLPLHNPCDFTMPTGWWRGRGRTCSMSHWTFPASAGFDKACGGRKYQQEAGAPSRHYYCILLIDVFIFYILFLFLFYFVLGANQIIQLE